MRVVEHVLRLAHPRHEPERLGLVGIDHASRQQQIERVLHPNETRQQP